MSEYNSDKESFVDRIANDICNRATRIHQLNDRTLVPITSTENDNTQNWLMMGLTDAVEGTLNPDEPMSFNHWLNSLSLATGIYGVYMLIGEAIRIKPITAVTNQAKRKDLINELYNNGKKQCG